MPKMLGLRITYYSHVGGTMLVELMWVSFKQRQVLNKYVEHKWSRMQLELVSIYIYGIRLYTYDMSI